MSRHCCIPGCSSVNTTASLCRVPAKRFCSGEKYKWAENLEKVILAIRGDPSIKNLYKRDTVRICHQHFIGEDIQKKGTRFELKLGALPRLNMPLKSVPVTKSTGRPSPRKRKLKSPSYHQKLDDVKKSAVRYLPEGWLLQIEEDNVWFSLKPVSFGELSPITICINKSLGIWAAYYGWATTSCQFLQDVDLKTSTLSCTLNKFANAGICDGISLDDTEALDDLISMHHKCVMAHPISGPPLQQRIAARSKKCDIFLTSGKTCDNCRQRARQLQKNILRKATYHDKVGQLPLARAHTTTLNSRKMATIRFQEEKLKELERQVEGLLRDREALVTIDPELAGDLRSVMVNVKENIVYSASSDKMVGFVDLGSSRNVEPTTPANHALQVYARGLVTRFSKPVAFYATNSLRSHQLSSIFWECVGNIEECGFQVVALVVDGLSSNRKMFHELNNLKLEYPYKCTNIFDPTRVIFLIFDPPHLLKTVRNNLYSSRAGGSRLLRKNGLFIQWEHFKSVPNFYASHELRCCKLTDAHFRMENFAKMRVSYASQLLSNTVARLMKAMGGPDMQASAWFAELFNKWFDLMNTTVLCGYNPNLKPYKSSYDDRLVWLETEFLPQLQNWKRSIKGETSAEIQKQFLSYQTYQGLEITTRAIVELVRSVLHTLPADSYILTKRINQDPLEAFFGHIRRCGGSNDNPDIFHYGQFQQIISAKKDLKARIGSNVRSTLNWKSTPVTDEKMQKRKTADI